MKKRILSMLLTAAMLFTMLPTAAFPAFAAETACSHVCSADNGCISTVKECLHSEHTDECWQILCEEEHEHTGECSRTLLCKHACTLESGCITEVTNCLHTECDAACGGAAGKQKEATEAELLDELNARIVALPSPEEIADMSEDEKDELYYGEFAEINEAIDLAFEEWSAETLAQLDTKTFAAVQEALLAAPVEQLDLTYVRFTPRVYNSIVPSGDQDSVSADNISNYYLIVYSLLNVGDQRGVGPDVQLDSDGAEKTTYSVSFADSVKGFKAPAELSVTFDFASETGEINNAFPNPGDPSGFNPNTVEYTAPTYWVDFLGEVTEWNTVTYTVRLADSVEGYFISKNASASWYPVYIYPTIKQGDRVDGLGSICVYPGRTNSVKMLKYDSASTPITDYGINEVHTEWNGASCFDGKQFNYVLTRSSEEGFHYIFDITPTDELVAVTLQLRDPEGNAVSDLETKLTGEDANGDPITVSVLNEAGEYSFTTASDDTTVYLPVGDYTWNVVTPPEGTDASDGTFSVVKDPDTNELYVSGTDDNTVTVTLMDVSHSHPICGTACSDHNGDGTQENHENKTWKKYNGENELTKGSYYLDDDVTLTSTLEIKGEVNLCLNGYELRGAEDGSVINLSESSTLNLCDCNGSEETHQITAPDDTSVTITGGVITGGAHGVFINSGTFNMYGGTIAGNVAEATYSYDSRGAGVYINFNSGAPNNFNMYGGAISYNQARFEGSGVYIYQIGTTRSNFNMYGGKIDHNVCTDSGLMYSGESGGAVCVNSNASMLLRSGTISYNESNDIGGGIAVVDNGGLTIEGGTIEKNTARLGAGIFFNGNGSVTMKGGAIQNNTASDTGGGIYVYQGKFTITDGIIEGNKAEKEPKSDGIISTTDGNIFLSGDPKIDVICVWDSDYPIQVTDELTYEDAITVWCGQTSTGKFAIPAQDSEIDLQMNDYMSKFTNPKYKIVTSDNGALALGYYTVADSSAEDHATLQFKTTNDYENPLRAAAEDTITVTVTPDTNYKITSITVTPADPSVGTVSVTGNNDGTYTFTMPASDVTVSAAAERDAYAINIDAGIQNGSVSANSKSAKEDATITLTVEPEDGYVLETLSVKKENGDLVQVTNNTFTMPAADVTVSATFKQIQVKILVVDTDGNSITDNAACIELYKRNDGWDEYLYEWYSSEDPELITVEECPGLVAGETYRIHVYEAPKGYVLADDITFTIDAKGEVTNYGGSVDSDGVLLVKFAKTKVSIGTTGLDADAAGAKIQILDSANNVVEEWNPDTSAHEVVGLKTEETYTIHNTAAPEGYVLASDTTFILNADGTIDTDNTTTKVENGALLVEFAKTSFRVAVVDSADVGTILNGVKFTIDGTEYTYDPIQGLYVGAHTLVIKADDIASAQTDYQCANDITISFTIKEDGSLSLGDNVTNAAIADSTLQVKLVKKIAITVTPSSTLTGIYGQETSSTPADGKIDLSDGFKIYKTGTQTEYHDLPADVTFEFSAYRGSEQQTYVVGSDVGTYTIGVKVADEEKLASLKKTFEITYGTGTLTINPKTLAIADFNVFAENKVWDGSDTAEVTAEVKTDSLVNGDKLNVIVENGKFEDSKLGESKSVTASITALTDVDGADKAKNYTLGSGYLTADTTASILPLTDNDDDGIYGRDDDEDGKEDQENYIPDGDGGYTEVTDNGDGTYTDDKGTDDTSDDKKYIPDQDGDKLPEPESDEEDGIYNGTDDEQDKDYVIDPDKDDPADDTDDDDKYVEVKKDEATDTYDEVDGDGDSYVPDADGDGFAEKDNGDGVFEGTANDSDEDESNDKYYIPDQDGDKKPEPESDVPGIFEGTKNDADEDDTNDNIYVIDPDKDDPTDNTDDNDKYVKVEKDPDAPIYTDGDDKYIPDQDGDHIAEKESDVPGIFEGSEEDKVYVADDDETKEVVDNGNGTYTDDNETPDDTSDDKKYIPDLDGDDKAEPDTDGDGVYEGTETGETYVPVDKDGDGKADIHVDGDDVKNGIYTDPETGKKYEDKDGDSVLDPKPNKKPSGSSASYDIFIDDGRNGSVTANHESAAAGTTITLEIDPNNGYELNTLTVTDKSGNVITLTEKSNGTYTFRMPSKDVWVTATFTEGTGDAAVHICPSKEFSDVNTNLWYHEAIDFVLNNELMQGYNNLFTPNGNLSRAMMVQVLYNMEGCPAYTTDKSFSDVTSDKWYYNAVLWAAENDIVEGYAGKYSPNADITREQMAAILYRYAQYKGIDVSARGDLSRFTDGSKVSAWAVEEMQWAVAVQLMQGNNNILDPVGNATRAQVAQVFMNYCTKVLGE